MIPLSPTHDRWEGRSSAARICTAITGVALAMLMSFIPPHRLWAQTAPTSMQVVHGQPIKTLLLHAAAMSQGNAQAVRDCYSVNTPSDEKLVDAFVQMAQSLANLRQAAVKRWGDDGFSSIGFAPMFDREIAALKNAEQQVDGSTARVWVGGPDKPPMILVARDNQWKISVSRSFQQPERRAARTLAQAGAFDELAAEISAGKYPLALDARVAGRDKVAAAMKAVDEQFKSAPSSQATSAPAN